MLRLSLFAWKRRYKTLLSLSLALATTLMPFAPANACGPHFYNRLLVERNKTLLDMPKGNFAFETSLFADFDKTLPIWKKPVEIATEEEIKAQMSTKELRTANIIAQMRASISLEQADALSKGLTPEERLYTLGAVAFNQVDTSNAADYFTQVVALPENEQRVYGLAAQYSLGRALMDDYITDSQESSLLSRADSADHVKLQLALAAFQKVIDRVKSGEPDDALLSLSSLGQQAAIHFWLGDIATSIHLYAQQSVQGDPSGSASLHIIANILMKPQNEKLLKKAIKDPLVQQLLAIQLFSDSGSRLDDEHSHEKLQITTKILALISSSAGTGFKGSDSLAAIAYRSGKYDMAATLLKNSGDSALSWWLRAKMALRNGDMKAATAAYAKTVESFPPSDRGTVDEPSLLEQRVCLVSGEQGILALNRGDYLQAMALFYRGKYIYRADLLDIAERVLTLDELKGFVDKNVHTIADILPKPIDEDEKTYYIGPIMTPDAELREVLARRLMRAKRYDEALPYFQTTQHRQWAKQFIDNLNTAQNPKIEKRVRAQAYYQSALILRDQGLELTSYAMTPDYAIYRSIYSYVGDTYDLSWQQDKNIPNDGIQPQSWITPNEAARAKAALPKTNNQFLHYRWKAAELASKSADLLSPKSQAYTAVLCHARSWIKNRDREGGAKLYRRYTKTGTYYSQVVHSQSSFKCPKPDFTHQG
ncbi:hypothetical protein [Hafnia paralvei]|uniref:hypothetical protein n=1 Tax=Hafnia paralvei TaxID=546367 RepID=UPI0024BB8441|nr:hypothetical protein [Hafnia paralvei]